MTPIPKRLKQARKKLNISQKALGIAAGIDEFSASARINQYEVGKRVPDYLTLKRLGKVLDYPVAFFYEEDDLMAEIISLLPILDKKTTKKILMNIKDNLGK